MKSAGENAMSKIREIREAIDTKLDKWEASATAIEAQLQLSEEQAMEELEVRKKRLNETLEGFKSEIVKAKGLADEKKTKIQNRFDELQVQLTLGKAEARDAFEPQEKKIRRSIATLESTIDHELGAAGQSIEASLKKAANKFIVAAIVLEAQMEALDVQFEVKKAGAKAQFEQKKAQLVTQINEYKRQLEEKKQMGKDKAATFENELSNGMSQIKQAFNKLFN
jgi:hypothetical protein